MSDSLSSVVTREWVIPPNTHAGQQCHASTVIAGQDQLVCAWFAGTEEGTDDNHIWLSRRSSAGVWTQPVVVAGDATVAQWNPVLFRAPDGLLWLFYKKGRLISEWSTWCRVSNDGGTTWQAETPLVTGDVGGRGPVKNTPVIAPDSSWLAPGSSEMWSDDGIEWTGFVDRSADGGRTWSKAEIPLDRTGLRGAGVIQPALWVSGSEVGALLRSTEGRAFKSVSRDNGRSFSAAVATDLPNNNSAISLAQLADGQLICAFNPTTADWGPRCPLALAVSDDGDHWRQLCVIEDGVTPLLGSPPSLPIESQTGFSPRDAGVRTDGRGEYSYPSVTVTETHLVVTYTWQRTAIVCATVSLADLSELISLRKASQ